jgi:hypothetical protein
MATTSYRFAAILDDYPDLVNDNSDKMRRSERPGDMTTMGLLRVAFGGLKPTAKLKRR